MARAGTRTSPGTPIVHARDRSNAAARAHAQRHARAHKYTRTHGLGCLTLCCVAESDVLPGVRLRRARGVLRGTAPLSALPSLWFPLLGFRSPSPSLAQTRPIRRAKREAFRRVLTPRGRLVRARNVDLTVHEQAGFEPLVLSSMPSLYGAQSIHVLTRLFSFFFGSRRGGTTARLWYAPPRRAPRAGPRGRPPPVPLSLFTRDVTKPCSGGLKSKE